MKEELLKQRQFLLEKMAELNYRDDGYFVKVGDIKRAIKEIDKLLAPLVN